MRTSETPSMSGVAASRLAPLDGQEQRPNAIRSARGPAFADGAATGGSGRFRIAVEIVITLTRQAEKATTSSVSSPPIAKATNRLCEA